MERQSITLHIISSVSRIAENHIILRKRISQENVECTDLYHHWLLVEWIGIGGIERVRVSIDM